jgi:hypothetical protein
MRREDDPYSNVPADLLEEVRKAEKKQMTSSGGILGGLVSSRQAVPRPHEGIKPARHHAPKRVSDIRSGHNYA